MTHDNDPLWNPQVGEDPSLQRIENLLSRYGARSRGVDRFPVAVRRRSWLRVAITTMAASFFALALLYGGHRYRLDWSTGQAWSITWSGRAVDAGVGHLGQGELVRTGGQQQAHIDVARIGQVSLSPDSALRLTETREGRHRVRLEAGHLHARIWAPPGYFGVSTGNAEVIDFGCEFDLWRHADGSGRVVVESGWVAFRVGWESVMVPQGYALDFDASEGATPLPVDADQAFIDVVRRLDAALQSSGTESDEVLKAANQVAAASGPRDTYTLLSLLTRYRGLARTELYPALAAGLGVHRIDPEHRAGWLAGVGAPVNQWWSLYPTQPKRWWKNWQDALPWAGNSPMESRDPVATP